jgi:hypothetical protein
VPIAKIHLLPAATTRRIFRPQGSLANYQSYSKIKIQNFFFDIEILTFSRCDAEDYIATLLEGKKPYNSFHFAK